MKNHGRTPIPVSRSDSIGQRTRQNGVGSHIDAVSLEILALTSITERGYWGIELGGHTQPGPGSRYLLVIKAEHMDAVRDFLGNNKTLAEGEWIDHKTGLLPRMLRMAKGDEPLEKFRIVEVGV